MLNITFAQNKPITKQIPKEQRMEWWQDARFGMFVHWGIYSVPAGQYKGKEISNSAEWIMNKGQIPLGEYEKFSDEFNPTNFDAKSFVALAKEAGMKYIVITSKHHDGFSMFKSKSNPFNIVNATPFKRDVLKELSEECQKQGLRFGFYYSQAQDWSHPGGLGNNWDKKMQHVSNDVYVKEKALPEVNQLLTEYGPISIFWWDTPRQMTKEVVDSLHRITSILQPGIITNDRLGEGYPGDYKTFERGIPKVKPDDKYWEICQPISASWGFKKSDTVFQTPSALIRNLVDIAGKGGNYLLNVSPRADGTLSPVAISRLKEVGKWMDVNHEAIYGTQAGPRVQPNWGRITLKTENGKSIAYLHVFDWKNNTEILVQLKNRVKSCYLLTDPKRIFETKSDDKGITVKLTGKAPNEYASVIVLNLNESSNAIQSDQLIQNADGILVLPAERAQFQNLNEQGAEYQENKKAIGKWTSESAEVNWTVTVHTGGNFKISAETASLKDAKVSISIGEESQVLSMSPSGDYNKFIGQEFGSIKISKAGVYKVILKPVAGNWNPVNLKDLKLELTKK
ncbi:Alpha-L-fucosidase [Arcticibacter svalbardensis MN12-7]|uniref:alpha-L-fucosidase n=2 Tax=Arcticibacter TaxID=1288026 RepID=R9GSS5_9SPHI|nr:Alpha-L-fucosidase [Arcticibacter svalbardensis MN12-7]